MYKSVIKSIVSILMITSLCWSGSAMAQGAGNHMIGGYLGFTDRNDADFTFGAEYEYQIRSQWSVGATLEYTPDVVLGRDFTLVLGTANFRPSSIPRLKLIGGLGVEFREAAGDDVRARIGAGYDVYQGGFTVTPRLGLDFGDGGENVVLGVTLSARF